MTLPDDLMDVLACPKCRGPLREGPSVLDCPACDLRYPVRDGIPILLIEEATEGTATSDYAKHTETDTESIAFYNNFYRDYNDYRRYNRADVNFVRKLFRKIPLTRANTLLTEAVMKVAPAHLSARLLVIGRRSADGPAPRSTLGDADADG